jgi:hypothetical protein
MTIKEILSLVYDGSLDSDLTALTAAINARQWMIKPVYRFKIGDKVRFNETASPRYIIGHTATVMGLNPKSCQVILDEDCGKFRKGQSVKAPNSIIQPA